MLTSGSASSCCGGVGATPITATVHSKKEAGEEPAAVLSISSFTSPRCLSTVTGGGPKAAGTGTYYCSPPRRHLLDALAAAAASSSASDNDSDGDDVGNMLTFSNPATGGGGSGWTLLRRRGTATLAMRYLPPPHAAVLSLC